MANMSKCVDFGAGFLLLLQKACVSRMKHLRRCRACTASHSTKAFFCSTIASHARSRFHRRALGVKCFSWLVLNSCVYCGVRATTPNKSQTTDRSVMRWTPLYGREPQKHETATWSNASRPTPHPQVCVSTADMSYSLPRMAGATGAVLKLLPLIGAGNPSAP